MKLKKCSICNLPFEKKTSLQKYCSPICLSEANRKKQKKKTSVKKKERNLNDTAWSLSVKQRDGFKCVYCGATTYLNSHHIFSRNNLTTRYDLDNGITLCAKHHTFSKEFSAHQTPTEFTYWLERLKGKQFIEDLGKKARNLQYEVQ